MYFIKGAVPQIFVGVVMIKPRGTLEDGKFIDQVL